MWIHASQNERTESQTAVLLSHIASECSQPQHHGVRQNSSITLLIGPCLSRKFLAQTIAIRKNDAHLQTRADDS